MSERPSDEELLRILHVARDFRTGGRSLEKLIRRCRYCEIRGRFESIDLVPLVRQHPELVDDWVGYSADKRTSGGFYLLEHGHVGQIGGPEVAQEDMSWAVAIFVLRELDGMLESSQRYERGREKKKERLRRLNQARHRDSS